MKSVDKEEIFALLNLLSDDDCPHPIWNDIANKIRMSKDKDEEEKKKTLVPLLIIILFLIIKKYISTVDIWKRKFCS